ncbi:MAG: ECF-type sigma factor, partial [Acidobacteriota bacterium]|nr:ECF-type sigma factor [Acidobacteriota bacterium]
VDQARANWINRAQFFAVAASLMRRIIVDHARARGAEKRGGGTVRVSMEKLEDIGPRARRTSETFSDVIAINAALDALAAFDPEQARLVELRFFAGLTVTEAAAVLQRSPRTVKREWRLARAWLLRALR